MTGLDLTSSLAARRGGVAVAVLLFAGIFLLRIVVDDPDEVITLLYALPIALISAKRGTAWGFAAAALALGLFGVWDAYWNEAGSSAWDYVFRGVAFFVLGGAAGELADRLRTVSAQSARFQELSTDLLCTAGFDGYFKYVNPAWERTLGWTLAELRSQPFVEFVHPDDRERTNTEAVSLTSADYETRIFENRCRCKDGSYRTMLWGARSIPKEGLIYASAREVTESKQAQEELRDSEHFLDSVLENLPNMVFVKDAEELRFVRFNRVGEELLGKELIGKNDHDLYPKQQADALAAKDREVLASGVVIDIPVETIETIDNGSRILHTRKIAIRDERGEPRYLLGISVDITDRKLAERTAEAAQAEAERANQAKSEFLSRMSHELRTPLNAIIGFAQLLALDAMDPHQCEAVEQILKAGRHLLEMINEVLDISRIESGTMSISLEPVDLGNVVAEALSLMGPLADEAQVRLTASPYERGDLRVLADPQRFTQVLINLLSNAIKYNRRGGEVFVCCSELAEGRMEVAVADTGCGMTADQLERLFAPFDRLGAEGGEVEGTGLGLSLSRGLMEAMGGTISAESKPGTGSTMRIQLDSAKRAGEAATARNDATPAAKGASGDARTIVYMEHNFSNLELVERLLDRLPDVRLIAAMQGELGIDLVRHHHPDLILLDHHLPDLHARDVLEQLKRDPTTAAIPVVVLSADATPVQIARLRAAGAAGYLAKPIDVESLLETVRDSVPTRVPR